MSSVLVTGAEGFMGRHLVPELRRCGHEVSELTRRAGDVTEFSTWSALPRADAVIHLAGRAFVPESWIEPEVFVRSNVAGTTAALRYCQMHGARLVFPSSYMYGDVGSKPIAEGTPIAVRNPYALSKMLAEQVCRFYAEQVGVGVTVLRPFNVYGPGQSPEYLVPMLVRQVRAGDEIRVRDLAPRRDFVYVADVARALTAAVARTVPFEVFNIGSGVSYSVGELIGTIQDVWGTNLPIVSENERRVGEIMDTVADITAAHRELRWQPRYSLRDGLCQLRAMEAN